MLETIYTSEKVMAYIYWGTHKITGQFYIGSRYANKKPSHLDFGTKYFTSCKNVKILGFDNFDWHIVAEFFIGKDAVYNENLMIKSHWRNPLLINKRYNLNDINFYENSPETRKKASEKLKKDSEEGNHPSQGLFWVNNGIDHKKAKDEKLIILLNEGWVLGRIFSNESKLNMGKARKGKPNVRKGIKNSKYVITKTEKIKCPHCGFEGIKNMTKWHFDKCKLIPIQKDLPEIPYESDGMPQ